MTEKNKQRIEDSIKKLEEMGSSIISMSDTLLNISKEFLEGSGFKGDAIVVEAARYLARAATILDTASAGMLSKLRESKELVAKQEAEQKSSKDTPEYLVLPHMGNS